MRSYPPLSSPLTLYLILTTTIHTLSTKDSSIHPSLHKPIERFHSLHKPFDSSSLHWRYGKSTVMTDKYVRLTPNHPASSGWLWNDYSLYTKDWEIELSLKITGDETLGGDGMAFWFLDSKNDPGFQLKSDSINDNQLSGEIFGATNHFKGFGVIIDTYDNNALQDNPLIFILDNSSGNSKQYNHNNDFLDDMSKLSHQKSDYKCSASIRNTFHPFKMLIRFVNGVIHVYIDSESSNHPKMSENPDYRLCLAVRIQSQFNNSGHIAFTALTGQLHDSHDIYSVSTRFLSENDYFMDDRFVKQVQVSRIGFFSLRRIGSLKKWVWFIMLVFGFMFCLEVIWEMMKLKAIKTDQINSVHICDDINKILPIHYLSQFILTIALIIFTFDTFAMFLQIPFALWHLFLFIFKKYKLKSNQFDKFGNGKYASFLFLYLFVYAIFTIYSMKRLSEFGI